MKPIYPRMLHPAGDVSREPIIVDDAGQEAAARVEGYRIAHEPEPEPLTDGEDKNAPPAAGDVTTVEPVADPVEVEITEEFVAEPEPAAAPAEVDTDEPEQAPVPNRGKGKGK